jgi:hypothetical protein
LKIGVDKTENKGSVAITLPPDFNLPAARLRKAMGGFSNDATRSVSAMTSRLLSLMESSLSISVTVKQKVEIIEIKHIACYNVETNCFSGTASVPVSSVEIFAGLARPLN